MFEKDNRYHQITIDNFQHIISRSFVITLSMNSLMDEVRRSSDDSPSQVLLADSLHQLNWISGQIGELNECMSNIFDEYPDHPYRLIIQSLLRNIPRQIERAQGAFVGMSLQSVSDLDIEMDKGRLGSHLYGLSDAITNLYNSLINIKTPND